MNAKIEKKAEELAGKYQAIGGSVLHIILEACRFTERVTIERAAGICRGKMSALIMAEEQLRGDEYGAKCCVIGRKQQVEECAKAIEAAAREGK